MFQGERLSHAVGCAFAACLERKQKREKECGVTATFDANRTTFTREGSFRVTTATEQAEREEVMRQLQDAKKGRERDESRRGFLFFDRTSPNGYYEFSATPVLDHNSRGRFAKLPIQVKVLYWSRKFIHARI